MYLEILGFDSPVDSGPLSLGTGSIWRHVG